MSSENRPWTANQPTYADLERVKIDKMYSEGKSQQQARNFSSSLASFMRFLGRNDADPFGLDFGLEFSDHIQAFITDEREKGNKDTSVKTKISHLKDFKDTARTLILENGLPESFADALREFVERSGLSQAMIAKHARIKDPSLISTWSRGVKNPSAEYAPAIPRLEAVLGAPAGCLQARLPTHLRGSFGTYKTGTTKYREKVKELIKDPFAYTKPCPFIRDEWVDLLEFYTLPFLLDGRKRNVSWRVKKMEGTRQSKWWYAQVSGGVCQAAQMKWRIVASFFGFLLREKSKGGKGFTEEELTLFLLSDVSLVTQFIEFRRKRSGVYTKEISRLLGFTISVTRPETGYFIQTPCQGRGMVEDRYRITNWAEWCEENRQKMLKVLKELEKGGHFKKGRPPEEPIAAVLALQHPIEALLNMVKLMERVRFGAAGRQRVAIHHRNLLLIKMLISNPLRVSHFSMMTYKADNTGNLYRRPDKSWCLRFDPEDFKNQKGAASKQYNVTLPKWLYTDIESYLENHRQFLRGSAETSYVFLPSNKGTLESSGEYPPWESQSISKVCLITTQKYIPNSPGFGPHAFRHIIATEYIKNNPNGFQVVSDILHDRLSTVLREYAHLKVADGFAFWSSYLTGMVDDSYKGGNDGR